MANDPYFKAISPELRLPPQNIEAEEAILGGILLDPDAIDRVAELLRPEWFAISAHQTIYRVMRQLHLQGQPTDLMTVTTWLADHHQLDEIGGQGKMIQLVDRTVSAVNIDQYASLVSDKFLRRKLIQAGNEIIQLGYDTALPLETVLDQAEQQVFGITQDRPQQDLIPIAETLINTFQDIENRHEGQALPGLLCDYYDLDAMTGGFQRSDLVIVAGRPSMGKCLSSQTEILLSDGRIATIATIYNHRHAQLLTLGKNWKFTLTQPSAFIDDGLKPVFRVTTALGRRVETTLTHPYLTIKGWQPLATLKPGTQIAVPRKLEIFGKESLPADHLQVLAKLIQQGNFTNRILATIPENRHPLLINWLESANILGEKIKINGIPEIVFKLQRSEIALFLKSLLFEENHLKISDLKLSEKLARHLQHLLLRFGVIAALQSRVNSCSHQLDWQLEIRDRQSLKTLMSELNPVDDQEIAEISSLISTFPDSDLIPPEIWQEIAKLKGDKSWEELAKMAGVTNLQPYKSLSRETLFLIATVLDNLPLQKLATSDIYWDKIITIEPLGNQQVYDLTIPETHNFVANDICVHNTTFCMNIARNLAERYRLPVAIFSLEMSKEQLVQRLLASEAKIESNRLRAGRISQTEWEPLSQAIGTLTELPIFIDDTPNITVTEIRSKSRRLQAEQGGALGLILLDYLQLMEGSSENRVQELSRITRGLKALGRELSVPVIALSQLSRSVESRNNKRPMMSDLRESGSIEQDADLVIMLYRDEYYNPDSPERGIAEVIITKHRNGPTGIVKLLFDPQFTLFRNLAKSRGN